MIIHNPEAANFLTNMKTRRYLGPFMEQSCTLTQAAKQLDLKLNTLHYHVQTMLRLGLLEIEAETVQNNHRIKLYRSTSDEYRVPLEASFSVDLSSHIRELLAQSSTILAEGYSQALLQQSAHWAFRIFFIPEFGMTQVIAGKNNTGQLQSLAELESRSLHFVSDAELCLNREDALSLKQELNSLYNKYLSKRSTDGESYWLQLGFTPIT